MPRILALFLFILPSARAEDPAQAFRAELTGGATAQAAAPLPKNPPTPSLARVESVAPDKIGDVLLDGSAVRADTASAPVSATPSGLRGPGLKTPEAASDPYLWLEPLQSPRARAWAQAQSRRTLGVVTKDPRYLRTAADLLKIYEAHDKLPVPNAMGDWVYNFWQDSAHKRGVWRRTKVSDYEKPDARWETILDVDALGAAEKENFVWEGADCLPPSYARCLVSLSRGGTDAVVVREFDVASRAFVKNGFSLPESKSTVDWMDADHVLVATDFGPGSMTTSGYPRIVKLWTRGRPLAEAKALLSGAATDVSASAGTYFSPNGAVSVLSRSKSFFSEENSVLERDGTLRRIPIPEDAELEGVFHDSILAHLRRDWETPGGRIRSGSLVSLPLDKIGAAEPSRFVRVVFAPDDRTTFTGVAATKEQLYLEVLRNVKGQVLAADLTPSGWTVRPVPLPGEGMASILDSDAFSDRVIAEYDDFLTPTTLYALDATHPGSAPRAFRRQPERFAAKDLIVEQKETASKDGTMIPYFLVRRRDVKLDGSNPTLLYAYGGFEESSTPDYNSTMGKAWLEKGGVYALANIRGGGEFGPKWHQAAVGKNRQRAFDDFFAVAEDLIRRKVTSPRRLGIMGGSNGGLLVGVALTERPDLFRAVVCQVPLLDMLRYTHIGAGASWIEEYGDPADPATAAVLRGYSPYQNVKAGVAYPRVLFTTSVGDDRVEPAHARKMAAKMQSLGYPVLYFENTEGGHSSEADLKDTAKEKALEYTFLFQQLFD